MGKDERKVFQQKKKEIQQQLFPLYQSSPKTKPQSQFEPHKRIAQQPVLHFFEASSPSSTSPPPPLSSSPTSHPPSSSPPPLHAENVQVPILSQHRSESSHQKATTQNR